MSGGSMIECEDTISRKDAILALDEIFDSVPMELTTEILALRTALRKKLPSVQPLPKAGHWIESDNGNMISRHRWYCSECGGMHHDTETGEWREVFDFRYAYCHLCGARMIEPQEGANE